MSRIRSIHPSQWTDEAFVECSAFARLLALGLRNEADDNGIFKWTPVGLKMRLFPADNVDVADLLGELERQRIVLKFDVEGRTYGAIRNFRVFQNPRSPKTEHPLPPEADAFVGARAGDEAAEKKSVGRPRKQHDAETPSAQQKSFPQSVENNSEGRGEEGREEESPSDSSIGTPLDQGADGRNDEVVDDPVVHLPVVDHAGEAFAAYEALRRKIVPGARSLDFGTDRRGKLTARLREVGGPDGWRDVLASIRGSPFLRGETSRNGFVSIDWLLEPKNLRKVTEGNYDERNRSGRAVSAGAAAPVDAIIAARAALGLG